VTVSVTVLVPLLDEPLPLLPLPLLPEPLFPLPLLPEPLLPLPLLSSPAFPEDGSGDVAGTVFAGFPATTGFFVVAAWPAADVGCAAPVLTPAAVEGVSVDLDGAVTWAEPVETRSECAGAWVATATLGGRPTPVAAPVASALAPTTRATVAAGT
jgi:signal-induced proliferation-associated 1 like protein 3